MKTKLVLTSLDQLRAFADPLRIRLIEELTANELPVAGLARALGVPVTRLYHHVDLLLQAGLIEVARQVRRRGIEERIFRAAARRYQLDGDLLGIGPGRAHSGESMLSLARSVLGGALDDLIEGINTGRVRPSMRGRGLLLEGRRVKLSADGFETLAQELPKWIESFLARHRTTGTGEWEYRIALAAFPAAEKRPRRPTQIRHDHRRGI
jgi:DNA-binding transcriptional ArsR family regulator